MHRILWSPTISLTDHITAARTSSLAGLAALGTLVPLALTTLATPVVDGALVIAAIACALGSIGVGVWRQRLLSLPLELADTGCRELLGGHPAYRFRVRLGRNRILTDGHATVRFVCDRGTQGLTPIVASLPVAVGPWTLLVVDRDRVCDTDGVFEVEVTAREGDRLWTISRSYLRDTLVSGRFGADVRLDGSRLVVDAERWDVIVPREAG